MRRAIAGGRSPQDSWGGCAALSVVYASGALWLSAVTDLPLVAAVAQGVLPFVVFDLAKVALAVLVAATAAPAISAARRV